METARFLAGSDERHRLLAHLRDSPGSPRDVADALDVSRRSVQRNLSELLERGWAEKRDGRYHLTTSGVLVARVHGTYLDSLAAVEAAAPFFRHLADADHAPDPEWLGDAEIVTASPDTPQAPVSHYVSRVTACETTSIRMLAPVLSRIYHEAHAELVLKGIDTELVLSREKAETAREMNPLEFRLVTRAIDIYQFDGVVGVGLTLGDDWALAGAYDDEGQLRAVVESDDSRFLEWAEGLYEEYREASELVGSRNVQS